MQQNRKRWGHKMKNSKGRKTPFCVTLSEMIAFYHNIGPFKTFHQFIVNGEKVMLIIKNRSKLALLLAY